MTKQLGENWRLEQGRSQARISRDAPPMGRGETADVTVGLEFSVTTKVALHVSWRPAGLRPAGDSQSRGPVGARVFDPQHVFGGRRRCWERWKLEVHWGGGDSQSRGPAGARVSDPQHVFEQRESCGEGGPDLDETEMRPISCEKKAGSVVGSRPWPWIGERFPGSRVIRGRRPGPWSAGT